MLGSGGWACFATLRCAQPPLPSKKGISIVAKGESQLSPNRRVIEAVSLLKRALREAFTETAE